MKTKRFLTIADKIEEREDIISLLDGEQSIDRLFLLPNGLPQERIKLYKKLYAGIGDTPVYTANLPNNNTLHIKSEYFNSLGNSHYSRLWVPYLFIAEILGVIIPGHSHLIEVTSGNSGIALSMACNKLGYELTLVLPSNLPKSRIEPMLKYGANIVKVNGYIDKCIHYLRRLVVEDNLFPCNHSEEHADIQVKIMKRIAIEYIQKYNYPDLSILGLGNGTSTFALFNYFRTNSFPTKNLSYYPDPNNKKIVLGLYTPNVSLRHIEPAKALSEDIVYIYPEKLGEVYSFFKYDTEIVNLGHSSQYAIQLALEISRKVESKKILTLAYDKNDRYS